MGFVESNGLADFEASESYKSIRVGFQWSGIPKFAVLTGENGCGKTHLLYAIARELGGQIPAVRLVESGRPDVHNSSMFAGNLQNRMYLLARSVNEALNEHSIGLLRGEVAPLRNPAIEVDSALAESGLDFRVALPTSRALGGSQPLALSVGTDRRAALDLSLGESALLAAVLWSVPDQTSVAPRVLLLDEPDVHLHTKSIHTFIAAVRTGLVERLGIRVIMTTHRPDTIALAPSDGLFQLRKGASSMERVTPAAAITSLSGGIFAAAPMVRHVIVEDDQLDIGLYRAMHATWLSMPHRSAPLPMQFHGSAFRTEASTVDGGEKQVRKVVTSVKLQPMVQGIVDRDAGNEPEAGVHVLGRYSSENYIADPIVMFATSLRRLGVQPFNVPLAKEITVGRERLIRDLPVPALQQIVDVVAADLRSRILKLTPQELKRERLEFTEASDMPLDVVFAVPQGLTLKYPKWLIDHPFKALRRILAPQLDMQWNDLLVGVQMVAMLPADIGAIFEEIAKP